jgi:hypothetical protein
VNVDPHLYIEAESVISFAGPAAEERATRGSGPGWRKFLPRHPVVCFHEAGHAVIARALNFQVYEISVIQNPERGCDGFVSAGISPDPPPFREEAETDMTAGVKHAALAAPCRGWKSALKSARTMRARARALVEENWHVICALAAELERKGALDRAAIDSFFELRTGRRAAAAVSPSPPRSGEVCTMKGDLSA